MEGQKLMRAAIAMQMLCKCIKGALALTCITGLPGSVHEPLLSAAA